MSTQKIDLSNLSLKDLLIFKIYEKHESYVVILNFGSETEFIDLYNNVPGLSESMIVEMASPNSGYKVGDSVLITQTIPKILILRPSAVLVFSTKSPTI